MTQADNGNPYALTGPGQQLTLTQPGAGGYPNQDPPPWVILQNDSSLQLSWSTGSNSGTIQAWATSPPIVLGAGAGAGSGPQQVTVTTSGLGSGDLNVTWSDDGDVIPAGYPSTSGVSASAVATQAAIEVVNETVGTGFFEIDSLPIPPGAIGLFLVILGAGATRVVIQGLTSGSQYMLDAFVSGNQPVFTTYNSYIDSAFFIQGEALDTVTVSVYALFYNVDILPGLSLVNWGNDPPVAVGSPAMVSLVGGYSEGLFEPGAPSIVPLQVDANGRQIPLVPTESTGFIVVDNEAEVIPALATGAYYLFGWDVQGTDSQIVFLSTSTSNADIFSGIYCVAGELMSSPPLGPMRITTAIYKIDDASSVGDYLILRYAIGP